VPLGFSLVRQGTDEDEVDNRKHRDEVHDVGADLRADRGSRGRVDSNYE
jgi:hypothetical protein